MLDGGIDIMKFNHCWYHRQTFDRLYPEQASIFTSRVVVDTGPLLNDESVLDEADQSQIGGDMDLKELVVLNDDHGCEDDQADKEKPYLHYSST